MIKGFKLCWNHKTIRWRLIFLALETSFEDAMVAMVFVDFSLRVCVCDMCLRVCVCMMYDV